MASYGHQLLAAGVSKAWASQAPVALGSRRIITRYAARASSSHSEEEKPFRSNSSTTSHDLKVALGIEAPKSNGLLDNPTLNLVLDKVEALSETVSEATESEDFQLGAAQFILLAFPIWLLYVLVAAKAIELPFPLPFLEN